MPGCNNLPLAISHTHLHPNLKDSPQHSFVDLRYKGILNKDPLLHSGGWIILELEVVVFIPSHVRVVGRIVSRHGAERDDLIDLVNGRCRIEHGLGRINFGHSLGRVNMLKLCRKSADM